ncbi:protein-disulfide reductase DsbD family protein [uncultured Enterovirga sp.]|uniref:protein-disulfide reductase DsbD family protein n=1 Tax=uncultured Enterovirga sp. TaxID=2026352 RepID=UPI0035CB709E
MRSVLAAIFACLGLVNAALAAPKASDLVQAELVAEPRAVLAGRPFTVAVRLAMKEHWHTYWRNPGDSGLATEIAWTLPPGFKAGAISWPTPSRIPVSHLVNFGYEGETSLMVEITPPTELPAGGKVKLKAQVSYLVCERECIPGEAALSTSLPVATAADQAGADPGTRYIFEAARAALPRPSPWASRLGPAGDSLQLRVAATGLRPERVTSAYFFPASETAIEHAAPQTLSVDQDGISLVLKRSSLSTSAPPGELPGVLVIEEPLEGGTTRQAFQIGTMPDAQPGATPLSASSPAPAIRTDTTLGVVLNAALFAFLGGLILNLMPCVFPVLSIKVLRLVKHSGQSRAAIRLSGLAYAAGVVASFLVLAAILLALRASGAEIGWGFQLQSPAVIAGLAFLLFAMGLSLSGAVEFGTSVAAYAGGVAGRSGPAGSFLTGVLAAVVATPCTAPFMGAAVGFALTASAPVALGVFAALGLGLAAPFVVLTFWPGLVGRLPRPGRWMETLKQLLAFPVYATVAWLVFVLSQQVDPTGLFAALIGLVLVGFAVWCWRLAGSSGALGRRLGQGAALASLLALVAIGWTMLRQEGASQANASASLRAAGREEPFSQARLDALRAEGRPVFVNMTAAWCITCLVNERVALSGLVRTKLDEGKITYLKGDWTNQNPEITRLLEQHGRSGVPLYVLYPGQGEPVVLPQILTEAMVLDSIARLPAMSKRAGLPSTTSQE